MHDLVQIHRFYFPSLCASLIAALLAILTLFTNTRRRVNRMMAWVLFCASLWQGSVFFYPIEPRFAVQCVTVFGGLTIYAFALLKEVIVAPWKSLLRCAWSTRIQLFMLAVYALVLSGTTQRVPARDGVK